jgi:probable HAF family extracellular repeat protein
LGWAETPESDTVIVTWGRDGTVMRLDSAAGKNFSPAALNDSGVATGNAGADAADTGEGGGFFWSLSEGFTMIESIGGDMDANGLNNPGVVIGGFTTSDGAARAFRWTKVRGMVQLGDPPAGYASIIANAVNDNQMVAATATDTSALGTITQSVAAASTVLEPERDFVSLPTLGGTQAAVVDGGITSCGVILGWAYAAGSTSRRAVAWVPSGCSVP